MPVTVTVTEATSVSAELTEGVGRLVGQLSRSAPPPTAAELAEIVNSSTTRLLVAHDPEGPMVGMLTLVLFRIPTGMRAWVEDVVVDEGARGQGVGEALVNEAMAVAGQAGARTVDLTSRPSREAANRLYQRTGFEPRHTNVYRKDL